MPLTNSQYDEIIRAYDARQLKNEHDREERTRYAYIKIPRLREIDDACDLLRCTGKKALRR